MNRTVLLTAALLLLDPAWARAEEDPAPAASAKETAPVRAGKTTVTVIDENESIDDIVSRVRAARAQEPRTRQSPAAEGPASRTAADPHPVRDRIRDARAARPDRPEPRARERVRARASERKAKPPRLERRIERLRSR
jgi:hypothetical protein